MTQTKEVVDLGEGFFNQTREIATFYVELCSRSHKNVVASAASRSPAPSGGSRVTADSADAQGGPPPPTITPAAMIAHRLKEIGDNIDEKVKQELRRALLEEIKPSIYHLGADQFCGMCRHVLNTCSSQLHSGWQQVTVVYMAMFGVVNELRQSQGESTSSRETMISEFAGEALQVLRLEAWVREHGGMAGIESQDQSEASCVPIEGTAV